MKRAPERGAAKVACKGPRGRRPPVGSRRPFRAAETHSPHACVAGPSNTVLTIVDVVTPCEERGVQYEVCRNQRVERHACERESNTSVRSSSWSATGAHHLRRNATDKQRDLTFGPTAVPRLSLVADVRSIAHCVFPSPVLVCGCGDSLSFRAQPRAGRRTDFDRPRSPDLQRSGRAVVG